MNTDLARIQFFRNLKIFLSLLFIITFAIFYYFYNINQNSRIDLELQNNLENLTVHYNLSLEYFYSDVRSIQSQIINDPKILEIIKTQSSSNLNT